MAPIKTAEEMARLDAIFAEIEAEERRLNGVPEPEPEPVKPKLTAEQRIMQQPMAYIVGYVKKAINTGELKTPWERVLAQKLIESTVNGMEGNERAELNILRNFANAVNNRLEKAEKSAREQDNHHYYKIFAEGVKGLLEAL